MWKMSYPDNLLLSPRDSFKGTVAKLRVVVEAYGWLATLLPTSPTMKSGVDMHSVLQAA